MTADQRDDAENKAGMARAVLDHEPAALVNTYWQADIFGHNSGICFGAEVRVADACSMHLWFSEGFVSKGGGEYAPCSGCHASDVRAPKVHGDSRLSLISLMMREALSPKRPCTSIASCRAVPSIKSCSGKSSRFSVSRIRSCVGASVLEST